MATPTPALKTAAMTTLAVASGVTALWLTLGALSPAATAAEPEVRVEYVDEAGNPLPNGEAAEPLVMVVDQFGEAYSPQAEQSTPSTVAPEPAAEPDPAYAEPAEMEYPEEYVEEDEDENEEEDDD